MPKKNNLNSKCYEARSRAIVNRALQLYFEEKQENGERYTHTDIRTKLLSEGFSKDAVDPLDMSAIVRSARDHGNISYRMNREEELEIELSKTFTPVTCCVAGGVRAADVAVLGARSLFEYITNRENHPPGGDLRIGIHGGHSVTLLFRELSSLLFTKSEKEVQQLLTHLPKTILLQALIGNLGMTPEGTPYTAFGYFTRNSNLHKLILNRFQFRGFTAPGLMVNGERESLNKITQCRSVMNSRMDLDVIVASCGHFSAGCISSYDFLREAVNDVENVLGMEADDLWSHYAESLNQRKVIGDFAWNPIDGKCRVLDTTGLPFSVNNVASLDELCRFRQGNSQLLGRESKPGHLMLLAGPCTGEMCKDRYKVNLIRSILDHKECPVSQVILGVETAAQLLEHAR